MRISVENLQSLRILCQAALDLWNGKKGNNWVNLFSTDLKPNCITDHTLMLEWKRFKLGALFLEAAQILQGALRYCILGLNYYLKTTKLLFSRSLSAGWMRAPVIDFGNGN